MSTKAANKLIGRIRRSTVKGKRFNAIMSDVARLFATGDISLKEGSAIQRVADEQLRKFGRELRKEQIATQGQNFPLTAMCLSC